MSKPKSIDIYELGSSQKDSGVIYLPVPWEATTSYLGGASLGPRAIANASPQLDFFNADLEGPEEAGYFMLPISTKIEALNKRAISFKKAKQPKKLNPLSHQLNAWVKAETLKILAAGKIPGIVGGDHSVPFGAFQAAREVTGSFGILHFDAHSDTRKAYLGYEFSHASIMYNAMTKIDGISKLTQVGIRDYCREEYEFTKSLNERATLFTDASLKNRKYAGEAFSKTANEIVKTLPNNVWISFDIDGLDPRFCPNTGTPVPGGLEFDEATLIIKTLAKSGRRIIGFDLCEVSPGSTLKNEWDGNVGMRLLYLLSIWALFSQGKLKALTSD